MRDEPTFYSPTLALYVTMATRLRHGAAAGVLLVPLVAALAVIHG